MAAFISDKQGWPKIRLTNTRTKPPWGYIRNPEDKWEFLPDMDQIMFAEKAMDFLDQGQSLRKTAAWLSEETGSSISHQALSDMWKRNRGKSWSVRTARLTKRRNNERARTKDEKEAIQVVRRKAAAKRTLTMMERKEKILLGPEEIGPPPIIEGVFLPAQAESNTEPIEVVEEVKAPPKNSPEIIFKPNPGPQTDFLAAPEKEVLYGGAAGGGKSYALIADPLRYLSNKNFNGLILRRTNDELRELIWKSSELYPKAYPGAKWQDKKSQWVFPSGARLWMTYLERDEDVMRYQGQAFTYIAIDELTQYATPFAWDYMRSRLRTTDSTLPTFMRATTNPTGPGMQWVKKMFVDPAPANTPFPATDIATGDILAYPKGHSREGKSLFSRRFIPATLYDNPHLTADGQYEATLLSLPEAQRRQLLYGDWTTPEGAAFTEFRINTHTCKPWEIPKDWRRFRSCDFGYSSASAVHWYAVDPNYGTLWVYRELYLSKHTGRDLAKAILAAERGENIAYGVLDSSCWHQRGQTGPSIAEEMIAEGCRWRPSDRTAGARVNGKNRFHEVLKVDEEGRPGIVFFDTCRQIIADLPVIPCDPKGTDDIDPRFASDHAYDSVRYGIMSRPRPHSAFDFDSSTNPLHTVFDSTFGY